MANYERSLRSGTSEETAAASTSQALTSPCDSMWDGWTTQTCSGDPCAATISLADLQGQGSGGVHNMKSYQTDLLSSWLSGFQSLAQAAGVLGAEVHDQPQSHQLQDGTLVYTDEFSRLNICSNVTSSAERPDGGVAQADSSSAASQLLMDRSSIDHESIMRPADHHHRGEFCETQVTKERKKSEESAAKQYLCTSCVVPNHDQSGNFDKRPTGRTCEQDDEHMVQTHETHDHISSRTPSPPSDQESIQMPSFGLMMQHLVGQYENNSGSNSSASTWLNCVTASSNSSQLQQQLLSDHDSSHLRPVQGDPTGTNTSTAGETATLHHHRPAADHDHDHSFPTANDHPYCITSAENMYAELHGLLTKTQQDPLPGTSQLHDHREAQAPASSSGTCNHVGWSQFPEVSSTQQQSIFTAATCGPAAKAIHNNRPDDPSSSHARKSRSTALKPQRSNPTERPEKRSSRGHEDDDPGSSPAVKRSCIEHAIWQSNAAFLGRVSDPKFHASLGSGFGIGSSSALDMHSSVGPALNTNGKPRARRGSATDPQSVYARHRRERISERMKILQDLVPNGAKVDIVTMLEEAIKYVKFLQLQVDLLRSNEFWIYTPTTYNGVDVSRSMGMHFQGMDSQA